MILKKSAWTRERCTLQNQPKNQNSKALGFFAEIFQHDPEGTPGQTVVLMSAPFSSSDFLPQQYGFRPEWMRRWPSGGSTGM